ncbi:MAG: TRAP transporter substrate-binding protein [Dethiobacteria bacterium]
MNRRIRNASVLLILSIICVLILVGCGSTNQQGGQPSGTDSGQTGSPTKEDVITLNLAHYLAESVTEWTAWDSYFAREVEKRTNGKVKIILHWSESLGKIPDLPELCSKGAVEMIATTPSYSPTWFRMTSVVNQIPFVHNNIEESLAVAKRLYFEGPLPEIDYKQNNMKLLFVDVYREYQTFAKEPYETLADLKGKKIRTWGPYLPRIISAVGAVPVDVMPAEMFESLQRGRVDGIPWGISAAYGNGLHEIAPYVNETGFTMAPGVIRLINLDVWNKLPADVQQVMEEVGQELMGEIGLEIANSHYEEAMENLLNEGATFVEFKDRDKWINMLPDFREEWVKEMEGTDIEEEAKVLLQMWNDVLAECRS